MLINFYKNTIALRYLITLSISILFLTACGLSGDRGGTGGETSSNNGNGSNGDSSDNEIFKIKEKIGINIERINGEINKVPLTQISIVSLNEAFQESGSGSIPDHKVENRLIGGYEIQLSSSYVERINQVVKVTFNNLSTPKEILYAPLYTLDSETESITVNAKSHYLLKKLFDSVETSSQLAELLPCSSSASDCPNQSLVKANMLEQINLAVSAYNYTVPSDSNINEAIDLLDQQSDLRFNIESAVNEITRTQSPFAKGTLRTNFNLVDFAPTTSQYYHSILFGLSLSNIKPDDSVRSVNIGSLSSTIDNSSSNPFPGFNQSTTLLDRRRDVLSSHIPFERTSLKITQSNKLTLTENHDINYLSSANTNDSFLSTQGFLLNERVLQQTIPTGLDVFSPIGWEFNPLFLRAYQTNEYEPPYILADKDDEPDYGNAPTWLTSSNYSKAASFTISGTQKPYTRVEQLEDVHLFTWEVSGLETNKDPGASLSPMNGKEYGAISYSLKLNDTQNTNAIQLIAETAKWQINSGSGSGNISMTQPTNHYKTLSLSRYDNNLTLGVRAENNLFDTTPQSITRVTSDNSDSPYQGLISFGGQGSGQPQGHATANGSYMALAFNTKQKNDPFDRGQGIIIASELVSFNYLFSGETYQIQGNSMEITSDKNIIHQLNGSVLEINAVSDSSSNDCVASLSVKRISIEHTIDTQENTLSEPIESSQSNINSQVCTVEGSELFIEFDGLVFDEPLSLKGFITQKNDEFSNQPGNLINLIWQQSNQLGLIFANKEQSLSPTFD